MLLVIDFETSTLWDENNLRGNPSPYIETNYLVSVGWWCEFTNYQYRFIQHNDLVASNIIYKIHPIIELQELLDKTTTLVAHNIKFEKQWLNAVNLNYNGKLICTQIREYVLAKGQKLLNNLADSCIRNGVEEKKKNLTEDYLNKKIGFEAIPMPIVEEYGIQDVRSCKALYENQLERIANNNIHLLPTMELMEEFSDSLASIEDNGIKIDIEALDKLEIEYTKESNKLKQEIDVLIKNAMGATPINIESPEQLSWVLYSRRVKDKHLWKSTFNLGTELRGSVLKPKRRPRIKPYEFVKIVLEQTEVVYKTIGEQCVSCKGLGYSYKIKSNGETFKKSTTCKTCQGYGIQYHATKEIAGFKLTPKDSSMVSIGGFSTDGDTLEIFRHITKGNAKELINKLKRTNQIATYLNTFIKGIRKGLRHGNILHPGYMQCITATGRLSSRNPNFQNQPRGNTFPVRRCIISRWSKTGGVILSGDAKQLEFRIAGELSNDQQIFADIAAGLDVHANTAKWTNLSRQDSKPYTFAPVYGATDKGKPENIAAYFRFFQDRYKGLFNAHRKWQDGVLAIGSHILPSGREFIYPNTMRYNNGSVSNSTIIANYPVQAFATADLMVIYCINTIKLYKQHNLKSLVILEVHDDVSVDVYPGELKIAARLMVEAFNSIPEECIKRYNYKLNIPLEIELKYGANWLDQKEYHI